MQKYKVLFVIDYFDKNGGASIALQGLILNDKQLESYLVASYNIGNIPDGFNIKKINSYDDIIALFHANKFDFIHYFKSTGYTLFSLIIEYIKKSKERIPIITTVCQQPNIKHLILSPEEIKYSDLLVFIDKTAFNCPIINFIPPTRKRVTYLGHDATDIAITEKLLKRGKTQNSKDVIFGRGSTLNKCHSNFIEVFNSIKIPNKRFIIAGINNPERLSINQENIEVVGVLPYVKWLELCNEFDIFLYMLPLDAYSSIDGTLGHAMLLEKPVVYYGPDAPKERIVNGENGFVATSIDEIPSICEKIAQNPELALKIGKNARESTIRDFNSTDTFINYHNFYSELCLKSTKEDINIPLKYMYIYCLYNWKRILKSIFRKFIN